MNISLTDLIQKNKKDNQRLDRKKWKNDKFEGSGAGRKSVKPAIKLTNLHWNVTEKDLMQLFNVPQNAVHIKYDNAGRSEEECEITFNSLDAAQNACEKFNGELLDGRELHIAVVERRARERSEREKTVFDRLAPKPGSKVGKKTDSKLDSRLGKRIEERLGKTLDDRLGAKDHMADRLGKKIRNKKKKVHNEMQVEGREIKSYADTDLAVNDGNLIGA